MESAVQEILLFGTNLPTLLKTKSRAGQVRQANLPFARAQLEADRRRRPRPETAARRAIKSGASHEKTRREPDWRLVSKVFDVLESV